MGRVGTGPGDQYRPDHSDDDKGDDDSDRSSRDWCREAVTRLDAGRPEDALTAAHRAADLDPFSEWAHRLTSLAFERLGRDADALPSAREAVRLALGSWPARVRLAAVLRRLPGHWDEALDQAALARRFAPEQPGPYVLDGDLALLRAEHSRAAAAYRAALDLGPGHPQARVNLGLTLLRWDRPRAHHDPAWPIEPRETGRARRALEVWSRQARLLVALATLAVAVAALGFDRGAEAQLGGFAVLVLLVPLTLGQARRIGVWSYVPGMLGRDPWLGTAVVSAAVSVVAFAAWLVLAAVPGVPPSFDPVWAGLAAIAVLGWPMLAALRALAETWRGRPLQALTEFTRAAGAQATAPDGRGGQMTARAGESGRPPGWGVTGERTARRNAGVALWIVLGRTWSVLVPLLLGALAVEPRAALLAVAVPYPLVGSYRRARYREDKWLAAATLLVALAAAACAAGGTLGSAWGWRAGLGALGAVAIVFALRAVRAWWRGAPGPWRASLIMCDLPAGAEPSVELTSETRQAFAYARNVVLTYGDSLGPRVVGAVATVGPSGELRLIAETEAWEAIEADPRVAVFAADPLQRRFWVEVRGIALADGDLLRVTPKQVLMGEFPGRHQRR